MIRVSCKNLEQVKINPALYAANLVSAIKSQPKRGMFSQWQSVIREIHADKASLSDAIKKLTILYSAWNDNERNRLREAFFQKGLLQYNSLFIKKGFAFEEGNHIMNWPLHKNVTLGGYTPWVAVKGEEYFSYLFTEQGFDWESELRFPLLQHYVSTHIIGCKPAELQMGVYCLADGVFEFRSFSAKEMSNAQYETRSIFDKLNSEYLKKKTTTR